MKPAALALDFRRQPGAAARRLGVALLVVALALGGWLGELTWRASGELAAAEARLALADQRRAGRQPRADRASTNAETLASARRAAAIAEQLGVPWDELFAALESADARPLGLLSMAPNARDRSLRITGEARSTAELLAYVERLAAQPALSQVHLVGYSAALRDGVPVVPFSLAASWRPRP